MFPHQKLDWNLGRLESEVREKPDDPAVRLAYGRALLSKGLFHGGGEQACAQALRQAQRVLKDDSANGEALVLAGSALVGMNRPERARPFLDEAIRQVPDRSDLHLALGAMCRTEGDRARSIAHFETACRLEPEAWEAHFYLGRALAEQARLAQHARLLVERAQFHLVRALRAGPAPDLKASALKDLGVTCLATGRYAEAERIFQRLREHPRYRQRARYHLGKVAYSLGKYKNAIHHLRTYLDDAPPDTGAWTTMAQAFLQLGELQRARETCNQALLLDPDYVEARYTLGCTVLEEGDPTEAARIFRLNLRDHPDHVPSYLEIARIRRKADDVRWLTRALNAEVGDFDRLPPFQGDQDPRYHTRQRISVLLDELKAMGPSSVGVVLGAVGRTRSEAVRFQLWEAATALAASQGADEVALKLRDPGRTFSKGLGRQAHATAHLLPEPVLTRGLAVGDEDLKREAVDRYGPAPDVASHRLNVERARQEARTYQALLLLAIARRQSRAGRSLLSRWAETADPEMATVARIGLSLYGDPDAIGAIRQVARARGVSLQVDPLLEALAPPRQAGAPRPLDPSDSAHCTACGRTAREARHLMAGSHAVLCDPCMLHVGRHRESLPAREGARCALCGRSDVEARGLYHYAGVDVCRSCVDLSLRLLEREEVDAYLSAC